MTSTTNANQNSTLSITQRLSISIEVEQTLEIENAAGFTNEQLINALNNSNAALDISSIILQVLGQFNPASLGNTDICGNITISGDAVVNSVDSVSINTGVISVGDELLIGESSTFNLITRIENFETTITSFDNRINSMETTIYVNDVSQTFYQIRTQQPHTFGSLQEPPIPTLVNSSQIKLNWNFDKILAKFNNLTTNFILNNTENIKDAQLPYINIINIDISGKYNNINDNNYSGWLNLATLNIINTSSYNIDTYKEFIINKTNYSSNANINNLLTNSNSFDIRIYGINNSINYPTIENRSLLFEQLRFQAAEVPDKPIFRTSVSQNESLNSLNLTFFVNETELGFSDSNALIDKLEISYNLADTYISSFYNNETISSPNTIDYSNPLYEKNTDFSIILNNLMPGSRYNFEARVQNNLNDNSFSDYSNLGLTNYTLLPGSNGIGSSINTNINGNKTYVTNNSSLNNNEIIYINLADNTHNLIYQNSNLQNIEITNPNASTTGTEAKGFGRLIDNIQNLVTLNVYVNTINKQSIIFDGSFSNNYSVTNNNTTNFISSLQLVDLYNNSNKGLRLKGQFVLNNIPSSDILSKIGNSQTTPHVLRYEYIRDSTIGGSNQNDSYNIYIDDLSLDPVIDFTASLTDTSCGVIDILYNMGIPSVMTFYLNFTRYYININSENLFIPGNTVISNIGTINSTSITNSNNILLNINDIVNNGYDSTSNTNMTTLNNTIFNNINYTSTNITIDKRLNWIEKAFNLYKPNGVNYDVSYITNHYIDYNSFNTSNNKINSPKLNLTNIFLHEINNISLLGSNLFGLTTTRYTSHLNQIKDYTLMYIDGKFQSNKTQAYPNINDFSYNGLTITNDFSGGYVNYDLSGSLTTTINNGYKFIAFEIKKSTSAQTPEAYIFNNITYNRILYDSKYYISIKSMLTNLFDNTTINSIFDSTSNEAIGFVRVTKTSTGTKRIGNLKIDYNPVGGNWILNGNDGNNISYNQSLLTSYGSKVENSNTNDLGIYIDPTSVDDDLILFIGLKNN